MPNLKKELGILSARFNCVNMKISFTSYKPDDIPAVKRFNQRFREANSDLSFPESNISDVFPNDGKTKLFMEYFLAKDENNEVRGGYYFKNQEYYINNQYVDIVYMKWPLSEGVINSEYRQVGGMIIQDMEKKGKVVFSLGMGGWDYPLPKRLKKNGWYMYLVPFYFFILKPTAFLRDLEYLKTLKKSLYKKIVLDFIHYFRLLYLFTFFVNTYSIVYRLLKNRKYRDVRIEIIDEFSLFADEIWEKNKDYYSLVAKRDHVILNKLYPKNNSKFHRLKISKDGVCIGWVVLLCTKMKNDKYFGNLNLGSIIDAFCKPNDSELLIYESIKYLKKLNADLIISNNGNVRWGKQYKKNGFIKGPSNFIIASSIDLKKYFNEEIDFENCLLMRGDGDGPINL